MAGLGHPLARAQPSTAAPTFFEAYGQWMQSPMPTWEDVAWLRELWSGRLVVKVVQNVADAERLAR